MPTSSSPTKRFGSTALAVMFVVALWLPLAGLLGRWNGIVDIEEKRRPAPPPKWGVDPVRSWPGKFSDYFVDHFGLRKDLLYLHNLCRVGLFGVSSSERVILGKSNWLFYTGSDLIDDFQGLTPFDATELNRWRDVIEGRQAWLEARGIQYLFVVVPNKVTIYPEYLPDCYHRKGSVTHADQLASHFTGRPDINYLDLRPVLSQAKRRRLVYYPYESHWNHYGAFLGYREIGERLKRGFPDIMPFTLDDYDVETGEGRTLCHMLGIRDRDWEPNPVEYMELRDTKARRVAVTVPDACRSQHGPPVAFEKPDTPRRLLVFHDSFLLEVPMAAVSEHFGRSVWLWLNLDLDFERLKLMVEQEQPDVVIEERIERFLKFVPQDHAAFAEARAAKRTKASESVVDETADNL